MDYYLDDKRAMRELRSLAMQDDASSNKKISVSSLGR